MSPERFQKIYQIFTEVVSIDPSRRADVLTRLCAGDMQLRREVERLLEGSDRAGDFLSGNALQTLSGELTEEAPTITHCEKCNTPHPSTSKSCPNCGARAWLEDPYELVGRDLENRYHIEGLASIGGMGAVYYAHHISTSRPVAFKILKPDFAQIEPKSVELFAREAKNACSLNHSNIVVVHDAGKLNALNKASGQSKTISYIAMEWLEGQTLGEKLQAQGPLDLEAASVILLQITGALLAAHGMNTIHRDLKPPNIMLVQRDGQEHVKVLDFGIAKVLNESSTVTVPMGTIHYASPEQMRTGAHIDGQSDVYSLGVIAYQMLSGQLPFTGKSAPEVREKIEQGTPTSIRTHRPELPEGIAGLIMSMLNNLPERRPRLSFIREQFKRIVDERSQFITVGGRVVWEPKGARESEPVPNASILLVQTDFVQRTDERGRFMFKRVPATQQSLLVSVRVPYFFPLDASYRPGEDLVIKLAPKEITIVGEAQTIFGSPVRRNRVRLEPGGGTIETDRKGRFKMKLEGPRIAGVIEAIKVGIDGYKSDGASDITELHLNVVATPADWTACPRCQDDHRPEDAFCKRCGYRFSNTS